MPPFLSFMMGQSGLVVVQYTRTMSDSNRPRSHVAVVGDVHVRHGHAIRGKRRGCRSAVIGKRTDGAIATHAALEPCADHLRERDRHADAANEQAQVGRLDQEATNGDQGEEPEERLYSGRGAGRGQWV